MFGDTIMPSDTLTRLVNVSEVREGEGVAITVGDFEPVAVFRVDGKFFVTQDTCSHAKASLAKGWLEGHEVCCPVHDGRFDIRTGLPLCFPVTAPITVFASELVDGAVWANLSAARRR
jgi:nitrite reductase/ring-hydroxylating ferredoxin subunit